MTRWTTTRDDADEIGGFGIASIGPTIPRGPLLKANNGRDRAKQASDLYAHPLPARE